MANTLSRALAVPCPGRLVAAATALCKSWQVFLTLLYFKDNNTVLSLGAGVQVDKWEPLGKPEPHLSRELESASLTSTESLAGGIAWAREYLDQNHYLLQSRAQPAVASRLAVAFQAGSLNLCVSFPQVIQLTHPSSFPWFPCPLFPPPLLPHSLLFPSFDKDLSCSPGWPGLHYVSCLSPLNVEYNHCL